MTERLYFDRPDVHVLADCHDQDGGRALFVVCEHPDGARYAVQLARQLGVPLHYGPGPVPPAGHGDPPAARPQDGQMRVA